MSELHKIKARYATGRRDFSGARLRRADLSHINLNDADLSGADLREANLYCANMNGADLSGANLSGANLDNTKLARADLSDANLRDANLRSVDMEYANLYDADLRSARVSGARFKNATLFGANLSGAKGGAILDGAVLRNANLSNATLRGAVLSNSDMRGANLQDADLGEASLRNARFIVRAGPIPTLGLTIYGNWYKDAVYILIGYGYMPESIRKGVETYAPAATLREEAQAYREGHNRQAYLMAIDWLEMVIKQQVADEDAKGQGE